MPTYEERLTWAPGDGHGLRVHKLARIFHEILPQAVGRDVFVSYFSIIIFYLVIVQKTALQGGILVDFH